MTKVLYWHVDAFADRPFSGNQAAVMVLDAWPDDAVLQAIGAENLFAETAFLVRDESGAAEWELRWFTPECEVRLCGHATLASGHVLLSGAAALDQVRFATRQAGVLVVRRAERGYEVGLPAIPVEEGEFAEAVAALGKRPSRIWRSPDRYNVFMFANEDEIRALSPDMRALATLGDHQFICTAPGGATDVVSRVFVPGAGVDEDSVTGSAHAALTPLWAALLGRDKFTAFQASARGGRLSCRLDGATAWLGGDCVTVVEGTFAL
ncbi:PhzF family phenazine biosynthesis protein [Novosphingobium tardum]|uniref:PhzF family phenazine biosynthesis protein n=1 Tax=Novosphingobium tardum TaxID=1538021 RepID=A0ABV8RL23_9SPHN